MHRTDIRYFVLRGRRKNACWEDSPNPASFGTLWYAPNKTDKEITAERAQMGKRKELASEEKVSLVEEYLAGRLRMREAARWAGVGHSTMENWISRYRSEGASGLWENGNQAKRQYRGGVKRRAVGEYLSGQGSSMAIAEKYQLCSENLVLDWVKAYHDRTSRQETRGSVMRKDHTAEKRLQAVLACLDGGKSLGEIAQAYP